MKNLYNWIIIVIFVVVLGFCVISKAQYETLKQDYNELLFQQSHIVDSLTNDNIKKAESIQNLESEILALNSTVDSLNSIKKDIQQSRNNFTISTSISEGSELLRQNLHEKVINCNF